MKISLTIVAIATCGTLMAQPLEEERSRSATTPDASRITFGGNFAVDPCSTCKYDPDPSGYAVVGPDNCTEPGTTQWEAVPFIAAASGVPDRIITSLILENPANCPENKVTLSIYTDACYPKGPGTLLVSGEATVPASSCDLAVAKIQNGPSLVQGTKYWITATTTSQQGALDSRWYAANSAQGAINFGDGWIQSTTFTPAFMLQGRAGAETVSVTPVVANARPPSEAICLSIHAPAVITIPTPAGLMCEAQIIALNPGQPHGLQFLSSQRGQVCLSAFWRRSS